MNFFKRKSWCYFHSLFNFVGANSIVLILIISSLLAQTVSGLECYICGTQSENSLDMHRDPCWEMDPRGEIFTTTCPTDAEHVCAKYARYVPDEQAERRLVSIWRGCTKSTTDDAAGRQWLHVLKCGNTESIYTETEATSSKQISCFCDTNYCNYQNRVKPSSIIISLALSSHLILILFKSRLIS